MTGYVIRPEQPGDERAIYGLVQRAFVGRPFSDGDEQDLVDDLRADGDLVLSLVAERRAGRIIGHIGFSPATIGNRLCGWVQMAPVAVDPDCQRRGIGTALIQSGIAQMQDRGAHGIAVLGDPAYYERFGFAVIAGIVALLPEERPYLRAMVLHQPAPTGVLRYAPAFSQRRS